MPQAAAVPDPTAESFEELLLPLLSRAYAAALGMSGNRADAEDLVQEAALRAWRGFSTFRRGTNFPAWFLRILTNVFRARLRRERGQAGSVPISEATEPLLLARQGLGELRRPQPDPAEVTISTIDTERVLQALGGLPEVFRTTAVLHFVEEFTYQEVAEVLGCSLGTVRSRIHRSRRLLRRALSVSRPGTMASALP